VLETAAKPQQNSQYKKCEDLRKTGRIKWNLIPCWTTNISIFKTGLSLTDNICFCIFSVLHFLAWWLHWYNDANFHCISYTLLCIFTNHAVSAVTFSVFLLVSRCIFRKHCQRTFY
jgi:hypothetical protein